MTPPLTIEALDSYLADQPQYRDYDVVSVVSALNLLILSAHPSRSDIVHLGFRKTVKTLSTKTSRTYRFKVQEFNDQKTSDKEYFEHKYKITSKDPDMPLFNVGGTKQSFLPAETARMIRVATKPPNADADRVVGQGIRELGFTGDSVAVKVFGASASDEMAIVPVRILGRPDAHHADSTALENWVVMLIFDSNQRGNIHGLQNPGVPADLARFSEYVASKRNGGRAVCIQAARTRKEKGQLQYLANVALKSNIELSGVKYKRLEEPASYLATYL
ncbi:hypothetical protein EST38_g10624 [Candolleomyces aberdarensis]|uniref:PAZ domain-containing protein n=1 Tax=Candolleomyces aberdarensis TaxID=2316362 RepID=A0A4Q2D7M3_9AGAR|nr:hypothetical protein EST38_g10624 [Candolleomyces aberdarensis]